MKRGRITKKKSASRTAGVLQMRERISPVRASKDRIAHTERIMRPWSLFARTVALILVLFFVFVPVGDAYADEGEVAPTEVPAPSTAEETAPEAISEPVLEEAIAETLPAEAEEASLVLEGSDASPEETEQVDPQAGIAETTTDDAGGTEDAESDDTATTTDLGIDTGIATSSDTDAGAGTGTSASTDTDAETVSTSTQSGVDDPIGGSSDTATTTESVPEPIATTTEPTDEAIEVVPESPEPVATTTATTTADVATSSEPAPEISTHTTDADRFSFGATECVSLGNGAFQCVRSGESETVTMANGPLYAAKDVSGDMEIYLSNDSGSRPITQNDYDDDAPSADPVTGDIVWHAQIDDRSQVMHYDSETGAVTRVTKEAYNSMQPAIYDGDIVFQAWIGNDWEIVLIDDADGREILTDNDSHDITPSITKEYIMWQAFEDGEWVGKVYDRRTEEIETVRGMDGGKVENPRMIMVFDSTQENGDTDTLGYDPVSGEMVSLAVTPVPQSPERIPEPEPEQEEKALVQPTVTTRTETKQATSSDPGNDANASSTEPSATDTASSTLAIPNVATTSDDGVPSQNPEVEATPLPIPDLVIPAFSSSTNTVSDEATTTPSA